FPLNQGTFRGAQILVAGENFGCGSSREMAVWAIAGMGFRCVVAPSFGDIFYNNCFQNGVLAIRLPKAVVDGMLRELAAASAPLELTVDLPAQTLTAPDGETYAFEIDALRKKSLVEGLDAIGVTLTRAPAIAAWQEQDRARRPWVWS
ncbi:MAG: 3-isopropylmalate dehydratase small subunit, partial [Bacteroidota bacterium]